MASEIVSKINLKRTARLAAAVLLGVAGCRTVPVEEQTHGVRQGGYRFINPLLECDAGPSRELRPFRHKLETLIDRLTEKGRVVHVSVYFRDLNNGPWFGINEHAEFTPASLLKVPLMITCLRLAQQKPDLLARKVLFDPGFKTVPFAAHFPPGNSIQRGETYTLANLVHYMIVYSDNSAAALLGKLLGEPEALRTYQDLGLLIPQFREKADFMTIKQYASFFRILFNATYLSKEMSERALAVLAQSQFREGLVAGVPSNVPVAHKFGERLREPDLKQLHDCGIVYYPGHPYLLGVMTRGDDYDELASVIAEISRLVYHEVRAQFQP